MLLTIAHPWKSNVIGFGVVFPFDWCNCSSPKIESSFSQLPIQDSMMVLWCFFILKCSLRCQSPLELRNSRGSFIESWFLDVCLRDEEVTVNLNLLGELGINLGDCFNLDIFKACVFSCLNLFQPVSTLHFGLKSWKLPFQRCFFRSDDNFFEVGNSWMRSVSHLFNTGCFCRGSDKWQFASKIGLP